MASNTSPFEARPRKRAGFPVAAYIGVGAAVAVAILLYYLNYTAPRVTADIPLTPEGKSYTRSLRLSDVGMKATSSYFGQLVVEVEGKIGNAGDRNLQSVEIFCVFHDAYGQLVLRKRVPIVSAKMSGLKPGETKSFRLAFDDIPDSWNQVMPQLVIAAVTFS